MVQMNRKKRFKFQFTDTQIAFLPSIGITREDGYKFCISAMWLNMQCRIGLFREE